MFRKYRHDCGRSAIHGPHTRWDSSLNRLFCRGIPEFKSTPWISANPSMGIDVIEQFDRDKIQLHHKHFYRLVTTLITSKGRPVGKHNIYWQCRDEDCWSIYFANRQGLYEELTRKQVEQTWPQ